MRPIDVRLAAVLLAAALACGGEKGSAGQPPRAEAPAPAAPATPAAEPPSTEVGAAAPAAPPVPPVAAAQPEPAPAPKPAAAPAARPAPETPLAAAPGATPAPAPKPAAAPAATPAPEVPEAATPRATPAPASTGASAATSASSPATPATPAAPTAPSARAKVGADKCRMCHRTQHQSWAESAHARKGLDCEGCHGNGGDYWPASVMRDRARAVAAGLVQPTEAACRRCHPDADASLLPRAHAHRAP